LFRSVDGGLSWTAFQNGFGTGGSRQARKLLAPAGSPRSILAASGRIEKSTDGGLTWRVVMAQSFAVNALESSPADPQTLWAGGESALFLPYLLKSSDAGETWKQSDLFAGGDNAVDAMAGYALNPGVVYLGMEGRVMRTEDNGTSWWTMTSPDPSLYTFGIAISPSPPLKVYAGGSSFTPDPRGVVVYRSLDGGLSWRAFSYPSYAGNGVTHILLKDGTTDETLYVGTGNGVFRYMEIPVGVAEEGSSPSSGPGCSILALYPIPAERTMRVRIASRLRLEARLALFDVSGRSIRRGALETLEPGERVLMIETEGLPGGVYFLNLIRSNGQPVAKAKKVVRFR
jgi:hypothetical protein